MTQPQIEDSSLGAGTPSQTGHLPPAGLSRSAGVQLGSLHVPSRFFLAPLAGYTNLGFRLAVRELGGVGLATTDLINARALVRGSRKTGELLRTCPADRPLAVQIYGAEPSEMRAAAQWLEGYGVSAVDINMGCPVHKVTRGGGGSALLCDVDRTISLVHAVVEAVRLPVTVKMRLGWDESSLSAPFFARRFEEAGVAGVTIHGRTRAQGFGGLVNLEAIRAVAEAVERIPVIGNGDIRTIPDAERMFTRTGCTAIAIGRGALLNPWFFAQLQRWQETGDPGPAATYAQRLTFMSRHFHLLVADRGERFGCLLFRKVANWYCKVLRPGHEIQQRMVRIACVADFMSILGELERLESRSTWQDSEALDDAVRVPKGPIEHW
ncbi:MAG TPA: tRNA dihydrouridine synthase DusB [Gemmataceae bacterium]|nr:tRNA dihydrouridine synthase DusB [Gemmataceae bacterium]